MIVKNLSLDQRELARKEYEIFASAVYKIEREFTSLLC
jgi:hypothetical protein